MHASIWHRSEGSVAETIQTQTWHDTDMKLNQVETNFQLMLSNIERMQVQAHEKCNLVINTLNLLKRHVRQNQDAHVEMSCRNVFFFGSDAIRLVPPVVHHDQTKLHQCGEYEGEKNESTFSHVHNSGCDCIALTICSSNSLDDIFNKLSMQRRW